nr:SPFH domain-containing protein [uncultured Glaciecola sp.]
MIHERRLLVNNGWSGLLSLLALLPYKRHSLKRYTREGGQALDCFDPSTHTLVTCNIPLIDKLINLPFGGDTPFSAEVWFVNTTVKRDLKWGTPSPIPLMDVVPGFPVSARSFGKWGARISDSRSFVNQIVGSQAASVLQVSASVTELSGQVSKDISKFQDVFAKTLEAKELSKVEVGGAFAAVKSFEVLNNAAVNESDSAVGARLGAAATSEKSQSAYSGNTQRLCKSYDRWL